MTDARQMKIIESHTAGIKNDTEEVLERLRDAITQIESGELKASAMHLVLAHHPVGSFALNTRSYGRALAMIGILEASKIEIIRELGI